MISRARLALVAPLCFIYLCCSPESAGNENDGTDGGVHTFHDGGTTENEATTNTDAGQQQPLDCGALPREATEANWGDAADHLSVANHRLVLMGGGAEVDLMSRSFVEGAGGGDVLVLRASGSVTSYLDYFGAEVEADPAPAQVSTVRLDEPSASSHLGVLCRVQGAESLWLAGGDQWAYLGQWSSAMHDTIDTLLFQGRTVGGTSAGAMVWGEWAFDAQWGSVTSGEVLGNPLSQTISLREAPHGHPFLAGTIVDTHFSDREREGRLLVFMAQAIQDEDTTRVRGLGIDGSTAISIEDGTFLVRSNSDGAVWYYETDNVPTLQANEPLNFESITRLRWGNGETGQWPPALDDDPLPSSWEIHRLTVQNGTIVHEMVP